VRLQQLQGLALARSGAWERASVILEGLVRQGCTDVETLGMLARTYKDRAIHCSNTRETRKLWRRAAAIYAEAHEASADYWTGINAATTALLIGEKAHAARLARKVRDICLRKLRRTRGDRYWLLATLGEAALITHDLPQAEDWYAKARHAAGRRIGDLQTSRRNAKLLLDFWEVDPAAVKACLCIPPMTIFAGHMLDSVDRPERRFPESAEAVVAQAISERIAQVAPVTGYASAACGSDILFLEAMLRGGREIYIVLPCGEEEFIATSVLAGGASWLARFHRVLEKATRVVIASSQRLSGHGISYDYANELILGLATIRAAHLETELIPIAVWDGLPGDGPGGTASAIARWRQAGLAVELIALPPVQSPNESVTSAGAAGRIRLTKRRKGQGNLGVEIRAMLFADAVGFSKLTEDELPKFVRHFLGLIGQLIRRAGRKVISKNTWGDGLYLVFGEVRSAALFALELADKINRRNWKASGLPAGLNLRIGVHAGPVYACINPIKQTRDFFGTHVSRTARIEPITPPGQVYASEAFAALAAGQQLNDLGFEYAGQVPMPNDYGIYPMYHMTRA
jgi:class 3 adenylate cyclase